jgi:hypothetical protein
MRAVAAQATDPKVRARTSGAADAFDKLAELEKAILASSADWYKLPPAAQQPVCVEKDASGLSSVHDLVVAECVEQFR